MDVRAGFLETHYNSVTQMEEPQNAERDRTLPTNYPSVQLISLMHFLKLVMLTSLCLALMPIQTICFRG